jgi:alginate O-acetyltransferase complex protein AlgI
MLFNSSDYVLFLPIVLLVYLLLRRVGLRAQNAWLLVASYTFYGWWDWRFLGLLFGTTLNDYLVGLGLEKTQEPRRRRALILLSIGVNLGVLGFFKYYNFFVSSLIGAFAGVGVHLEAPTLRVILPVGISFYTFQALTYTIAVYRRDMHATRDPIGFFAYVAFFPQLVAGPIERARHLLPQFFVPRVIEPEAFASGLRQMIWGFFCKLVVADNCATVVDAIFDHKGVLPGSGWCPRTDPSPIDTSSCTGTARVCLEGCGRRCYSRFHCSAMISSSTSASHWGRCSAALQ